MKKQEQKLEKVDLEYLKEGLRRTYKERFLMATHLYRIQQIIDKAVISHKPFVVKQTRWIDT